jgi:flagellum-specific ATP synthase
LRGCSATNATVAPVTDRDVMAVRKGRIGARIAEWRDRVAAPLPLVAEGRLVRMVGMTLEAVGCEVPIGGRCRIVGRGHPPVDAEAVGFAGDRTFLMPVGHVTGLTPNARVMPVASTQSIPVGEGLLGRVIDPLGRPMDGQPLELQRHRGSLHGRPLNPLSRAPIGMPLDVGVRAINGLLTVGRGQRMGLFAGSGVGKSTLLGMMARHTRADVIVVGLIGERGREVNEFISEILGPAGRQRAVVVVAPADEPPMMRLQGALAATAVAEYFRDTGRHVLLLMDSLTRFAQAQREIGLAIGEPPVTRGYTPSVFARLPQLLERAGNVEQGGGSITAFYTILVEGDYEQDPIADSARAVLDGHIVLARRIAERGRYPAIDLEASISRVMHAVADPEQVALAQQFRQVLADHEQNRDLISVGAYRAGADPRVDRAVALFPKLEAFMAQGIDEAVDSGATIAALRGLLGAGTGAAV